MKVVFKIGKIEVPVSTKPNSRLKVRRLSVSSNGVLVEAPPELLASIDAFLEAKSAWIFAEWQKHKSALKLSPWPEEFTTGAKVLYLGRFKPITVNKGGRVLEVIDRGYDFQVICPDGLMADQRSKAIRDAFADLFSDQVYELAKEIAKTHRFEFLQVEINRRKDRWAVCRDDGTIVLGWDLIFLPKPVIEYVIVHELVHRRQRNHGTEFWTAVGAVLPDWRDREAALRECEEKYDFAQ